MGLDMYLYRVEKLSDKEVAKIRETGGKNLPDGTLSFPKDSVDTDKTGMYKDLKPYFTEVKVINSYYDMEKLTKENDIPEEAYLGGRSWGNGKAIFSFYWGDGSEKSVELNPNAHIWGERL